MDPALRVRLRLPTSPKGMGRRRQSVTVAMAENSSGRSVPRRGGAVIVGLIRVWHRRFVFGGRRMVRICGELGLLGGGGGGRVCER